MPSLAYLAELAFRSCQEATKDGHVATDGQPRLAAMCGGATLAAESLFCFHLRKRFREVANVGENFMCKAGRG